MEEAREFAEAIHAKYPGQAAGLQLLALVQLEEEARRRTIASFQHELAKMGYKFQFVTLAGFHALNLSMFELARGYRDSGMTAYSRLQEKEFARKRSTDTRPSSTSASLAPGISTHSRR